MRNELITYLSSVFEKSGSRVAILGVGNTLNGDDAAGNLVARSIINWLQKRAARLGEEQNGFSQFIQTCNLLVIDAGPSPESFTGPLRRFQPDTIILVDAAELREKPGVVRVYNWDAAEGVSASTHGMPPTLLAKYLVSELNCVVSLVGIQHSQLCLDSPVSDVVRRSVRRVGRNFINAIARQL